MGSTADIKENIIKLHLMGCDYDAIRYRILRTEAYIYKVLEEYNRDGTYTVNSRLNRIEYDSI